MKINYNRLFSAVQDIIKTGNYNVSPIANDREKIKELLSIYHLAHPNFKVDHSTYMGILNENGTEYAIFLSGRMPPEDLYDRAIVVTSAEFEELCKKTRIRTKILGESNELIAIIVSSHYLKSIPLAIKFELTH